MPQAKYVKVGGAWKPVIAEYVKIGGVWKSVLSNYTKIGGSWKPIPVGAKMIFACEQFDDRLHAIDDTPAIIAGWPKFGIDEYPLTDPLLWETITDPYDVACDNDGNSYWVCTNGIYKVAADGTILWRFDGHTSTVKSICVDSAGNVFSGDFGGVVKRISSAGAEVWSKTLGASYAVYALAVDQSAGYLYAGTGFAYDAIYRLYVSNGNFTKIYTASYDVTSIAIDEGLPSLYVGYGNGHLLKISTAGYLYYDQNKGGEIYAVRVGHDGLGYYVNGSGRVMGQFVLSSGSDVWSETPIGTAYAVGLAVDQFGNSYGAYRKAGASTENVIRKRNTNGAQQWTWQPYTGVQWYGLAVAPGIKAAGM